jgi:hypothetical protein
MGVPGLYFPALVAHFDAGMARFGFNLFAAALLVLPTGAPRLRAAATNEPPNFQEVYDLVRAHLPDTSDAELNRAAVEGLLTGLRGKVRIVGSEAMPLSTNAPLVIKSSVLDDGVAFVRVGRVGEGLAEALRSAHQQLSISNKLMGLVLDLH